MAELEALHPARARPAALECVRPQALTHPNALVLPARAARRRVDRFQVVSD